MHSIASLEIVTGKSQQEDDTAQDLGCNAAALAAEANGKLPEAFIATLTLLEFET